VFVTIQERGNRTSEEMVAGLPRLAGVTADASELPACLGRHVPFKTYWMPFRSGERGFYVNVAIGDDVSPEGVAELQAVRDSLVFRETQVEDDRQRGVRFSYSAPWQVYTFARPPDSPAGGRPGLPGSPLRVAAVGRAGARHPRQLRDIAARYVARVLARRSPK